VRSILSIDGGGVRGFLPCSVLVRLEAMSGRPVCEQFDLLAGTSIGGVLAALLSVGVPATECLKFFTEDGPDIFQKRWWRTLAGLPRYPARPIEAALSYRFGGKRLTDCRTHLLVTASELVKQKPAFFRSHAGSTTPLWQVARATSAAQTYFPAYRLGNCLYWDGGNVANNPSVCAMTEAVKLWPDEPVRVLSLGCGPSPASVNVRSIDWLPFAALATVGLLFEDGAEEVDCQMANLIGSRYVRLQPHPLHPLPMDGADPAQLAALAAEADRAVAAAEPALRRWLAGH